MKSKKNLLLFVLLISLSPGILAQARYRSPLSEVTAEGFYALDIPVSVVEQATRGLVDLRITNKNGKEIAYLIKKDAHSEGKQEFIPYKYSRLASKEHKTRILIETEGDTISSLTLNIKNADIHKVGSIEGSNDRFQWFGIKENINFSGSYSPAETNTYVTLDLPRSDYRYYQLTIDDSLSAPLNITDVGQIVNSYSEYRYLTELPIQNTSIRDSFDITIITLDYVHKYDIKAIHFYISAPAFYKRLIICDNNQTSSILDSDRPNSSTLSCDFYTNRVAFKICNKNDRPLQIDSIKTYADKFILITYLPEVGNYYLTYADSTAQQPNYDLSYFENKIPENPQTLTILSTEQIVSPAKTTSENLFLFYLKKYGIWTIIILVSAQILYSVWKMARK